MLASKALISPRGRLTRPARWFAVRLALVVPFVHAHLMTFGYNRTLAVLRRFVPAKPAPAGLPADIGDFALGMRRLMRRIQNRSPLPGSCLSRSLALWWMLRRQGIETALRIGTRRFEGRFQAHAWVEYCARSLNAGDLVRYEYLDSDHNFTLSQENARKSGIWTE